MGRSLPVMSKHVAGLTLTARDVVKQVKSYLTGIA
jgi:hypothetical protein